MKSEIFNLQSEITNLQSGTDRSASSENRFVLPPADAYVFDIDGTLLVTRDLVHWNALHQAMLDVYGVDTSIEAIPYHGMTDTLILRAALVRAGLSLSEINERLSDALKIIQTDVVTNGSSLVAEACASVPVLLHEL